MTDSDAKNYKWSLECLTCGCNNVTMRLDNGCLRGNDLDILVWCPDCGVSQHLPLCPPRIARLVNWGPGKKATDK